MGNKIATTSELAGALAVQKGELFRILDSIDDHFQLLEITDPSGKRKPRIVVHSSPRLADLQKRLLRRVLCRYLSPSRHSHGGVLGRSIKTNASEHIQSRFAYTADISNFFPSIRFERVRAIFERLGMRRDTAGVCTKLTSYRGHLELGIPTSPFLADQILIPFDNKIASACAQLELIYTRFVDDITISGPFSFDRSGIPKLVARFLAMHGFSSKKDKEAMGAFAEGATITKLRIRRGHLDVSRDFVGELMKQMEDHRRLGDGQAFDAPYFQTENQIWGKIQFVSWINPRRRPHLLAYYREIDWTAVYKEAQLRGLLKWPKTAVRKLQNSAAIA